MKRINNEEVIKQKETPDRQRRLALAALLTVSVSPVFAVSENEVPLLIWQLTDNLNQALPTKPSIQRVVDYLRIKSGIRLHLHAYPWNRALKLANEGSAPIWGLSQTPDRLQRFVFSHPIFETNVWMLVSKSQTSAISNLASLTGKRVSIFHGVSYGAEFDAAKNTLFKVEEDSDNLGARMAKLIAGRCDVMLHSNHAKTAEQVVTELSDYGYDANQLRVIPNPLLSESVCIAILKEKAASFPFAELNLAIDVGRHTGEIERLLRD